METNIPVLPKHIFWDIELKDSTFKNYPGFVIVRVFERGDIPEIRAIRRYYGDELIKTEILKAKHIEAETLNFLSAIYNIPQNKFRCYIHTQ